MIVVEIERPRKLFEVSICNFLVKNMKKGYIEMTKKIYLETLKNVLGRSISHYWTSDQSLFRLQNWFRKIPLLVIYYLTKFDNIKWFLSYSKNYNCKFIKANSWHRKLFHFHLSFWIWEVRKGREQTRKIWISWDRKELSRWNKKHFS